MTSVRGTAAVGQDPAVELTRAAHQLPASPAATQASAGSTRARQAHGPAGWGGHLGPYRAAVVVLALGAVALTLWFTSTGVGLTTDSATYLSAANNLAHGRGATTAFAGETTRFSPSQQVSFGHQIPMPEYPPLYSLALSAPDAAGLSRSGAVRVVNAISLAALVALVGVALWWLFRPPVVVLVALGLLVVSGPTIGSLIGALNPLGLATFALSEALFLPLCLLALLVGAHAAARADRRSAACAAALVALATLTRYVGASAGVATGAAVLLVGTGRPGRRAVKAAVLAMTGVVAVVGWDLFTAALWGGGSPKSVVWHPGNIRALMALDVAGAWFHLPPSWPSSVRGGLVVALVIVPAVLMLAPAVVRWLRPADTTGAGVALLVALGTFVLAYLAAVGVTQILLDASTVPNQRLLAPVQLVSYLLLAAVLALGGDRLAARYWAGRRLGCALVILLAVAVVVQPLFRLDTLATAVHRSAATTRAQTATDPLRSLPRGLVMFSDSPSGLWLYSGQGSYRLPTKVVLTTGRTDRSYKAEVRQTEAIVKRRGGLIVVSSHASAVEYTGGDALQTVGTCRSGEILLAVPGTKAAAAAARACPHPAAGTHVAVVKRVLQRTPPSTVPPSRPSR